MSDGTHIKGLVLNFFRHFWPSLLKPPVDQSPEDAAETVPFFASFVTPLLKASKKKGKKTETCAFFSMPEFNDWRKELDDNELKKWQIKYYKVRLYDIVLSKHLLPLSEINHLTVAFLRPHQQHQGFGYEYSKGGEGIFQSVQQPPSSISLELRIRRRIAGHGF